MYYWFALYSDTGIRLCFKLRSYGNDKKKYIAIDQQYIFE